MFALHAVIPSVPLLDPVYPASARHSIDPISPPVPLNNGQGEQKATPDSALYVFAIHAVKPSVPLLDPVYPALATQAVTEVEPVAPPLAELSGHSLQAASDGWAAL